MTPEQETALERLRRGFAGVGDITLTLGKGALMQPVAGYYGLNALLGGMRRGASFDEAVGAGAEAARGFEERHARAPTTETGRIGLEGIGKVVEPVAEWAKTNIADPVGERSPFLGAALIGAAGVVDPVRKTGAGKAAGAAKKARSAGFVEPPGGFATHADPVTVLPPEAPTKEAVKAVTRENLSFDPAKEYPPAGPPNLTYDPKKDRNYLAKQQTPEAQFINKLREQAQADINAGRNYEPYFDPEKRFYVDPSKYNLPVNTVTEALPKKPETIAKYTALADTPEARQRLLAGFLRGKDQPLAQKWYAMGQLEQEFTRELGAKAGRKAYEDWVDAYAATTGGSNPTENLMTAHYAQFADASKLPIPEESYKLPFPIGGRYVGGNIDMYKKMIHGGKAFGAMEPKRTDFKYNIMGRLDPATIDEQMMTAFDPSGVNKAPPGGAYGAYEKVVQGLAKAHGIPSAEFQDVTWKGLKDIKDEAAATAKGRVFKADQALPLIEHVNQAIERTHRITGLPKEEIVRRGIVRKEIPLYGVGAGALGLETLRQLREDEDKRTY